MSGIGGAPKRLVDILHLDRDIRHRRPRASFAGDADLGPRGSIGGKGDDPANVHRDIEVENLPVERLRPLQVGPRDVGDDAQNTHIHSLSFAALPPVPP